MAWWPMCSAWMWSTHSDLKLLKDLEAKREGVSEGVKSVLRQRESKFSFIHGLVADVLRVDVEHAFRSEALEGPGGQARRRQRRRQERVASAREQVQLHPWPGGRCAPRGCGARIQI